MNDGERQQLKTRLNAEYARQQLGLPDSPGSGPEMVDINSMYPANTRDDSTVNLNFTCPKGCTINGEYLRCEDQLPHPAVGLHYAVDRNGGLRHWVSRQESKPREAAEIVEFARRAIVAAGRRCADADEVELAALLDLMNTLREAIQTAVDGMRARGHSWAYIASATGTSRENAYQRWGKK